MAFAASIHHVEMYIDHKYWMGAVVGVDRSWVWLRRLEPSC